MVNKILLIDDDSASNFYHKIILNEADVAKEIVDFLGVDDAISYLTTCDTPPEIIFLDINMPVKNAWDFLKEYEELKDTKRAKQLFILSTTKMPSDLARAKSNVLVNDFFTKPLTEEIIQKVIVEQFKEVCPLCQ